MYINWSGTPTCTENYVPIECIACGSNNRSSISKTCSNRERELALNKIKAIVNISYKEVTEKYMFNCYEWLDNESYDENLHCLINLLLTSSQNCYEDINYVVKRKSYSPRPLVNPPPKRPTTDANDTHKRRTFIRKGGTHFRKTKICSPDYPSGSY